MTPQVDTSKAPVKRRAPTKTARATVTKSNSVIATELKHVQDDLKELSGDVKGLRETIEKLNSRFTLFFGLGIGAMAASGLISEGAKEVLIKLMGVF